MKAAEEAGAEYYDPTRCTSVANLSFCSFETLAVSLSRPNGTWLVPLCDGASVFFRSMWRHEQMSIKMAIATCAHHSVQTDSHRPKVAVFDQGIQVGVPRHHEFDVGSSPMSSDPGGF